MKCKNISKDNKDHSLYINPNGLCNQCMMIKDSKQRTRRRIAYQRMRREKN